MRRRHRLRHLVVRGAPPPNTASRAATAPALSSNASRISACLPAAIASARSAGCPAIGEMCKGMLRRKNHARFELSSRAPASWFARFEDEREVDEGRPERKLRGVRSRCWFLLGCWAQAGLGCSPGPEPKAALAVPSVTLRSVPMVTAVAPEPATERGRHVARRSMLEPLRALEARELRPQPPRGRAAGGEHRRASRPPLPHCAGYFPRCRVT